MLRRTDPLDARVGDQDRRRAETLRRRRHAGAHPLEDRLCSARRPSRPRRSRGPAPSAPSPFMSETTTRAPASANRSATARPMPCAAPVTSATSPFRRSLGPVEAGSRTSVGMGGLQLLDLGVEFRRRLVPRRRIGAYVVDALEAVEGGDALGPARCAPRARPARPARPSRRNRRATRARHGRPPRGQRRQTRRASP